MKDHNTLADRAMRALEEANDLYRKGREDGTRYSLLALAHSILHEVPNATHLVLEHSDQGPHMTPSSLLLVGGEEDDDPRLFEDDALDLYGLTGNLDNESWMHFWEVFAESDQFGHHWSLDLQKIVRLDGDYDAAVAEMKKEQEG